MQCFICQNKNLNLIKIINNNDIFECQNCKLGITNKKTIKKDKQSFYNFEEYQKSRFRLEKRIEKLIKIIKKFVKKGKVLDIGAGFGLFSSLLLKSGKFEISVIEPFLSTKYLTKEKIKKYQLTIEKFLEKEIKEKYDLIIMMDILEHLKNPKIILKKIRKIMKKDGYLVIQIPNYKSLMAKICQNWSWWMIEDHRFHFSPKSIKLLLKKTDYKINFFMTYEDFYDFKKNFDGNFKNIKNSFLRKLIKFVIYTPFFGFYFLFRKLIWKLNYGGLIFIIAKK